MGRAHVTNWLTRVEASSICGQQSSGLRGRGKFECSTFLRGIFERIRTQVGRILNSVPTPAVSGGFGSKPWVCRIFGELTGVNMITRPFFSRHTIVLACVLGACAAFAARCYAVDLITEDEAKLPPAAKMATRGGITRGPSIKVMSPGPDGQVKAPFAMKVEFQPHGGSKIDASSVKVTYLRKPAVDLTPRLKSSISESGISLADANIPAGAHDIKIDVTDAEGRTKSEVVSFTVVK